MVTSDFRSGKVQVYEYGMVRVIGDEKLAKAIQEYAAKGFEPVTVTWVGNRPVGQIAGSLVHPAAPPNAMIPMFVLIVRRPNEISEGIES